ncbi:hypothetical protein Pan44_48930 [Caulifigura coniformis]|uniref:Uncharacterized protein n=1 Tax=Caulifigura coniformis TaxID=2527983 RepID=A0A517SL34_9PLAN|nr:hypothetical protein [Caulifigura coniformis]QDT56833.1 hypothetical protein Pan44_48930 [Caulifigura coniformis]
MSPATIILERLAELRRKLTAWLVVDGLSRVLAAAVLIGAADLLLDWSFQMDRPQRAVMLVLSLGALATVAYRRLWRPLTRSASDEALALRIEEQNPVLHERLISALQLAKLKSPPAGASPQMTNAVIEQGVAAARQLNLASLLDRKRLAWNGALLAVAVAALGGTAAAGMMNDTIALWFQRNLLLSEREWPQDVHFQIVGAKDDVLMVPRGDDWLLEAEVTEESRRVPVEAWLEIRGERQQRRMDSVAAESRRFQVQLAAVNDPIEFRIVESSAASAWTKLEVVDRPEVRELSLTATPPAYTKQPGNALLAEGGPYQLLKGTALMIRGNASKRLSKATISHGKTSSELSVSPAGDFEIELAPGDVQDGDYALTLMDTESIQMPGRSEPMPLTSRVPTTFRLKLLGDKPPQVQAKLKGVSGVVTTRALIPIEGRLSDDFALAAARLQRRHRLENAESDVTGTIDLAESTQLGGAVADLSAEFDLEPLAIPPGVSVSFFVEADDFNDVTGPGVGRSSVFVARVVTDAEFRASLLAREREQAVELGKRLKLEEELLTETKSLDAATRGVTELEGPQRDQLARIRKRQKTIGEDAAKVARKFEEIVAEIRNNRIEEVEPAPLQARLRDRIIAPLWKVSTDEVDAVLLALDQTTKSIQVPAERGKRLNEAATAQQRLVDRLREILSQMEQAQGFQEAVNLLLEVQKAQEDVLKRTEQEKQDAIRRLLEPGKRN